MLFFTVVLFITFSCGVLQLCGVRIMHPGTKWCVLKSCTLVKSLLQLSPRVMSEAGHHVRVCPPLIIRCPVSQSSCIFLSDVTRPLRSIRRPESGADRRAGQPGINTARLRDGAPGHGQRKNPSANLGLTTLSSPGRPAHHCLCALSSELGTDSLHNTVLKISPRRAELA